MRILFKLTPDQAQVARLNTVEVDTYGDPVKSVILKAFHLVVCDCCTLALYSDGDILCMEGDMENLESCGAIAVLHKIASNKLNALSVHEYEPGWYEPLDWYDFQQYPRVIQSLR